MQQEFGFEDPTFSIEAGIRMLQSQMDFIGMMWLEGEVSEFKVYRGVNWYFTLKDFDNVKVTLKCAMFQKHTKGSPRPNLGDRIQVKGRFQLKKGNLQFVIHKLQKLGAGGKHEKSLDELKQQLRKEGLFDDERKRMLPKYPRCVGVVTSKESAALQDVLKVLQERLPTAEYILSDTTTEGPQSANHILQAIQSLQQNATCEVIIVTRGGGSRESLMGFNDEQVTRAIANSPVPVVCAIGHETDYVLAELAADLRASTPTKAAMAVAKLSEQDIQLQMVQIRQRLQQVVRLRLQHQQELLAHLPIKAPQQLLDNQRQKLAHLQARIRQHIQHRISAQKSKVEALSQQLEALSPQHILNKGFSVTMADGQAITRASDVKKGMRLVIQLAEGSIEVEVVSPDKPPTEVQLSLFE